MAADVALAVAAAGARGGGRAARGRASARGGGRVSSLIDAARRRDAVRAANSDILHGVSTVAVDAERHLQVSGPTGPGSSAVADAALVRLQARWRGHRVRSIAQQPWIDSFLELFAETESSSTTGGGSRAAAAAARVSSPATAAVTRTRRAVSSSAENGEPLRHGAAAAAADAASDTIRPVPPEPLALERRHDVHSELLDQTSSSVQEFVASQLGVAGEGRLEAVESEEEAERRYNEEYEVAHRRYLTLEAEIAHTSLEDARGRAALYEQLRAAGDSYPDPPPHLYMDTRRGGGADDGGDGVRGVPEAAASGMQNPDLAQLLDVPEDIQHDFYHYHRQRGCGGRAVGGNFLLDDLAAELEETMAEFAVADAAAGGADGGGSERGGEVAEREDDAEDDDDRRLAREGELLERYVMRYLFMRGCCPAELVDVLSQPGALARHPAWRAVLVQAGFYAQYDRDGVGWEIEYDDDGGFGWRFFDTLGYVFALVGGRPQCLGASRFVLATVAEGEPGEEEGRRVRRGTRGAARAAGATGAGGPAGLA